MHVKPFILKKSHFHKISVSHQDLKVAPSDRLSLYGRNWRWRVLLPVGISIVTDWNGQDQGPKRRRGSIPPQWALATKHRHQWLQVLWGLSSVCTYTLVLGWQEIGPKWIRVRKVHVGVSKCHSQDWFHRFLTAREVSCNMERGNAKMSPAMLDWNWKYQYEHNAL